MGKKWLFLMVRHTGNHEFPDYEKNSLDLDFLLLMSCTFVHEFPFFKIKQHVGNCFTRYLQRREKQFPGKQFLYLLRNHNECCPWILKHLQHWASHMASKKSNPGIHDASKHLNREINSQLDPIIFDLGIHKESHNRTWQKRKVTSTLDKNRVLFPNRKTNDDHHNHELSVMIPGSSSALSYFSILNQIVFITTKRPAMQLHFHMCF